VKECLKFRIEGRVQGVWFRESTRQQAESLGITGYARNCADGSVEVLACGTGNSILKLRNWLEQGPPLAQVNKVEERLSNEPCAEGFTTGSFRK
jgi:acylphosphatase